MNPVSESTYDYLMSKSVYGSYLRRWTDDGTEVHEVLPRGIAFVGLDVDFPSEHTYGWMEMKEAYVREGWSRDGWEAQWWPEHCGPWASHWTIRRRGKRDVLRLWGGMTTADLLRIADWIVRKGWPSWARVTQWSTMRTGTSSRS